MKITTHLLLFLFLTSFFLCSANNVTYDHRSLIINGERKLVISGAIHYPRSVPEMWPELVQKAKDGGVNVIESYVFWNGHERVPGNYHFDGRFDLVKFVKVVQEAGLYMFLRIGPFVAAEWNYGGVPVWLHYIPGSVFRIDSAPYKFYMQRFMTVVVNLMKQHKLFASQGGPIVLSQVDNEYGDWYESRYGEVGVSYAQWAAKMAVSQNIGVPWVMSFQMDAPDPVIDSYNGFYADTFESVSPKRPKIWTENWTGWILYYGDSQPYRPPEDLSYSVARFFQKGGCLQNYYMYHGGTNFGRTSSTSVTTSYDYDAPIDEYGIARLPTWGHLKELHKALQLCEHALFNSDPINLSLGPSLEADVYTNESGECAAFLSNMDDQNDRIVEFRNVSYHLPAWSVSILPDCKNVVINTAKVASQTTIVEMLPEPETKFNNWGVYVEKAGLWGQPDLIKDGLVDHLNTTKDVSDYLWCTTSIIVDENEDFLKTGNKTVLRSSTLNSYIRVFVNLTFQDQFVTVNNEGAISLKSGKNEISLLSFVVGLDSAGVFYEFNPRGLTSVQIDGFNNGTLDLSKNTWTYKIGLRGEYPSIYDGDGLNSAVWEGTSTPPKNQSLTWYKVNVDPPPGNEPVALDMSHMGKGLAWLNGEEIGRYWPELSQITDNCTNECDYRGTFDYRKCLKECGEIIQRWYHIPRSWLKPLGNTLVIFEEKGGDPTKIRFVKRKVTGVCSFVAEDYPTHGFESLNKPEQDNCINKSANAHLECPKNTQISAVKFASFGTPIGVCRSYRKGDCHDPNSISAVEEVCLYKNSCSIELSAKNFDTSLCPETTRKLAIEAVCS